MQKKKKIKWLNRDKWNKQISEWKKKKINTTADDLIIKNLTYAGVYDNKM